MADFDPSQQLSGDAERRARQMMSEIGRELEAAMHAAKDSAAAVDRKAAWNGLQLLFARYDAAAQLMRELRRVIDDNMPPHEE